MEIRTYQNNLNITTNKKNILVSIIGLLICLVIPFLGLREQFILLGLLIITGIIFLSFLNFKQFIFLIIITKPIIDLTWNIKFIEIPSIGGSGGLNIQGIFASLLTLILMIHLQKIDKLLLSSSVVKWLIIFSGISFLGIFLTNNTLPAAIANFFRIISGIPFFFFAGKYFRTNKEINKLMWSITFVLWIPLFISILEYMGILPYQYFLTEGVGRLTGGYKHPSNLMQYFVFSIPFSLFLLTQCKSLSSKILLIFNLLLTVLVCFYTYLRMGYILICAQFVKWYSSRHRKIIAIIIFLMFGLIVFLKWYFLKNLFSTLFDVLKGTNNPIFYTAFSNRIAIWTVFLSDFFNASILNQFLGQGLNHIVDMNKLTSLLGMPSQEYLVPSSDTHNDFVRILTENGFIGLIAYLGILFEIYRYAKRLIKRCENTYSVNLGKAFILSFWGLIFFSLTISPSITPSFMWYFYVFTSIIVYQSRKIEVG